MTTTTNRSRSNGHTAGIQEAEQLPPHNYDAEEALLGSIMIDADRIAELELLPEAFFDGFNRATFKAMKKIQGARQPIDFITVADEMRGKGIEDDGRLIGLLTAVPTSINILGYETIIRDLYNKRQLIALAGRMATNAFDTEESTDGIISDTLERVRSIGADNDNESPQSSYDVSVQVLETLSERRTDKEARERAGLRTGFIDLDRLLQGISPGSLVVCAARPGMGKSVLEQSVRLNVAKSGKRVAAFNLEMTAEQLTIRALSSRMQVDFKSIEHPFGLTDQYWELLNKAIGELSILPMFVDTSASLSIAQLESKAHRLFSEHGHFDLITVDYLQLMRGREGERNRVLEVGQISRGMKKLAKELNTVVWSNAQVNRGVENRAIKKPTLPDLRESGDIEQDADIVMFIYRDEYYNSETDRANIAEIDIAKNRNGELGQIDLFFNGKKMLFRNLTRGNVEL